MTDDNASDGQREPTAEIRSPPPVWTAIEANAVALMRRLTGDDVNGHVARRLRNRPGSRLLLLGAGAAGIVPDLVARAAPAAVAYVGPDADLVADAHRQGEAFRPQQSFIAADLNTVTLTEDEFDVVYCHAALHRVNELEHLSAQIRRCLRPGGVLVVVDVVSRNRYLMWPETREIVGALWRALPWQFRLNHTAYASPRVDDEVWEPVGGGAMECPRSEDILPLLETHFRVQEFVSYFAICRRFFDTMYGPNYDLSRPLDRSLVDWIWQLDLHYVTTRRLRPETFFGIYAAA